MKSFRKFWYGTVALIAWVLLTSSLSYAADENMYQIDLGAKLLSDVQTALPERSAVNQGFLSSDYNPNLSISADTQLAVTFIDEGAGYRNAVGYFEFDDGAFDGRTFASIDANGSGNISFTELNALDGVEADILFSNFSETGGGGSLSYGDTLVVGGGSLTENGEGITMSGGKIFEAGSNVGFFVSANAWNGTGVKGVDQSGDPANYYSVDFLNPEAGAAATFGNADEYARHTAMMFADLNKDSVLVGFEDLKRPGGDNDFNDAVFLIQSNPVEAIQGNPLQIATAPGPNMGGGLATGIIGLMVGGGFFRRRRKLKFAK